MARVSDKILVAIAVAVTAMICISGSVILLDSSGRNEDINIAVSADIEEEITTMFAGFETYTNSRLHIIALGIGETPSFGSADMIMTTDSSVTAAGLATPGLPAGDIESKVMVMPDGTTLVYVFFDTNMENGIAGALMNWAFSLKQDIFVTVSPEIKTNSAVLFREFEKKTNAKVQVSAYESGAALSFAKSDMIMTTQPGVIPADLATADVPEGSIGQRTIVMSDGTPVYVFYKKDAQNVADHLIDTFFAKVQYIYVTIAAEMLNRMEPLFRAFEAYTNAEVVANPVNSPGLSFASADIIMTSNIAAPSGVDKTWVTLPGGPVFVYSAAGADGMTGMFKDWLSSQRRSVYVSVLPGTESYMGGILAGFESSTGTGSYVSSAASPDIGTGSVMMTTDRSAAAAAAGPGIRERMYMAPDGTPVYVLSRDAMREISDPLTEWLFGQKAEVRVTVRSSMAAGMQSSFNSFEAYTNAKITVTATSGSPPLMFTAADIIMTSNIAAPSGVDKSWLTLPDGPVFVYSRTGADGMTGYFADWLSSLKRDVYVSVLPGTAAYMESVLTGFADDTEMGIRISSAAAPAFGIGNVMMTADRSAADAAASPGTTERMYMAPDGTPVYVLFGNDMREISDPLTEWLFGKKIDVRITISQSMASGMQPFFDSFEAYSNANVTVTAHASPPLAFAAADIIMTSNLTAPSGVDKTWVTLQGGPVFIYSETGAGGMTGFITDMLSAQKRDVYVSVLPGTGTYIENVLAGFAGDTDMGIRISSSAAPAFGIGNVLMTTDRSAADAMASPGVTERMYMASDGTPVYTLFRDDMGEISDPLTEWLSARRIDVRVTVFATMMPEMRPYFDSFEAYANANIIITQAASPPPLSFVGTDIIITVNTPHTGYGTIRISPSVHAYFQTGIGGMAGFFIEWLPDMGGGINVAVSDDIKDKMEALFADFENDVGTGVAATPSAAPTFAGGADMIMTSARVAAGSLVGGGVTTADIIERAYVMSDMTIVYIYLRTDAAGTSDPLMGWLFAQTADVNVTVWSNRLPGMQVFFLAFEEYANVSFIITTYSGSVTVTFGGTVDVYVTGPGTTAPFGNFELTTDGGPVMVFYDDPKGMAEVFVDWLYAQAT